jgi:hypothetical protein
VSFARQKGTTEETAIVNLWNNFFGGKRVARRNPASAIFDITVEFDQEIHRPIQVLSMRANHGERLYVLREEDFIEMFNAYEFRNHTPVHIEAKHYAKSAVTTLFKQKFGKRPR